MASMATQTTPTHTGRVLTMFKPFPWTGADHIETDAEYIDKLEQQLEEVRKLIGQWDHSEWERENEERDLICRHASHTTRTYAPCQTTKMAKTLNNKLNQEKKEEQE